MSPFISLSNSSMSRPVHKVVAKPRGRSFAVVLLSLLFVVAATTSTGVMANTAPKTVPEFAEAFAQYRFELNGKPQKLGYEDLDARIRDAMTANSDDAELIAWAGIVRSSLAGASGGLGVLKMAKQSRRLFEKAMKIDPNALDGGARTSLGVLYTKVPRWPLGFGDKKLGEALMTESAGLFPDNLSAQFFLAEFYEEQGRKADAIATYRQALAAPVDANALTSDTGYRKLITERLSALGE